LSILLRTSLALLLAGCTPEQSKSVGAAPKQTVDKATADVNKAMQQETDRQREAEEKK
jgi:PBP1b-binding outer membrane lipoprotein LpoB